MADDPLTPAKAAAEVLANEKTEQEIRKLRAEAAKAEVDSLLPTLPSALPRGALSVPEQASPLGVDEAYRALGGLTRQIARELPADVTSVWIVPDGRVASYRTVHGQVSAQLARLQTVLDEAGPLIGMEQATRRVPTARSFGPTAALSFAASAVPLLMSLFTTDTTVRQRDVPVGFTSLAALVAAEIRQQHPHVQVSVAGVSTSASDVLTSRVEQLTIHRDNLVRALATYRARHVDEPTPVLAAAVERLAACRKVLEVAAGKDNANPDSLQGFIGEITAAATALGQARTDLARSTGNAGIADQAVELVDAFLNQLGVTDAAGLTPLAMAGEMEAKANAHVLLLEPSYAGAESVYEQKIGKDRGLHMGVAVVTYVLLSSTGDVVASGVQHGHSAVATRIGTAELTRVPADKPARSGPPRWPGDR